jgi:aryl sulfotransferase
MPTRYRSLISDSARWDGFEFRPGDIVISTAPKCGTTWMQMICALLVFQTTTFEQPLDLISPWLDMLTRERDDVFADLAAQTHRRFIKTHTPLDGLPFDPSVTYVGVGRDPRDVAMSWDNHMANMNFEHLIGARAAAVGLDDLAELFPDGPPMQLDSEIERFWHWVDDPTPPTENNAGGLISMMNLLTTFWNARDKPNVVLFHYDDLKTDLEGQMRRLAEHLGIPVREDLWPELVDAASFERMRDGADRIAPDTAHAIWQDNRQFFHRGESGQWRALLDSRGLRRYHARVAELAEPDLVRWVHRDAQLVP